MADGSWFRGPPSSGTSTGGGSGGSVGGGFRGPPSSGTSTGEGSGEPVGGRPKVLVIDHHDSYTWNLVHLIGLVIGGLPDVVEHDEPFDLDGYTHLVLSPGPGHPGDPADFARPDLWGAGVPVLGVCLGMQALVTCFGGRVERIEPAHGELARIAHDSRGLFANLPQGYGAVRYHSLGAVTLPDIVERTAYDALTGVTMGVRHRELPLAGVQFHPESILSEYGRELIENFLRPTEAAKGDQAR